MVVVKLTGYCEIVASDSSLLPVDRLTTGAAAFPLETDVSLDCDLFIDSALKI